MLNRRSTSSQRAYWDESGHAEDPKCRFVGIAGLLAPESRWEAFGTAWQAVLDAFDLPYFHAAEFAHWKGTFANREVWPEERRRVLMSRLLTAVALARPRVHGAVLDLAAWRALSAKEQRLFRDPWFCCLQECARLIAVHCQLDRISIDNMFSQQTEFGGKAAELWSVLTKRSDAGYRSLGGFEMADMRNELPLQAADLVAYEVVKFATDGPYGRVRFPFRALLEIDPNAWIATIDGSYLAWQVEGVRFLPKELQP